MLSMDLQRGAYAVAVPPVLVLDDEAVVLELARVEEGFGKAQPQAFETLLADLAVVYTWVGDGRKVPMSLAAAAAVRCVAIFFVPFILVALRFISIALNSTGLGSSQQLPRATSEQDCM